MVNLSLRSLAATIDQLVAAGDPSEPVTVSLETEIDGVRVDSEVLATGIPAAFHEEVAEAVTLGHLVGPEEALSVGEDLAADVYWKLRGLPRHF